MTAHMLNDIPQPQAPDGFEISYLLFNTVLHVAPPLGSPIFSIKRILNSSTLDWPLKLSLPSKPFYGGTLLPPCPSPVRQMPQEEAENSVAKFRFVKGEHDAYLKVVQFRLCCVELRVGTLIIGKNNYNNMSRYSRIGRYDR